MHLLLRPWPWYVAGPAIGLFAPLLLLIGNRMFGVSSNLRHMCAAVLPGRSGYFKYDWRSEGGWNLAFAAGILAGGFLAGWVFANPEPIAISAQTKASLASLGRERRARSDDVARGAASLFARRGASHLEYAFLRGNAVASVGYLNDWNSSIRPSSLAFRASMSESNPSRFTV